MAPKPLRVVSDEERDATPPTLLEAVESGDLLAIMKAQRRIIAESLITAAENTRPQYSNELNKLNKLIAEEESRRSVEAADDSVVVPIEVEAWDGTGY
ncbi:hypothetical protein IU414_06565 [Nocardia farcinica]|uniref:hypothetical protein n=1 Tax=Nocardia farcinica TaxID=37329 RepID=UPI001895415A|nr:hypothetical protein [Nocardia farcinica]MBF6188001.1 hypothetical protein [Nocardia farcinica]MBF6254410.1 hypothetical protein [Nocardia farcinica]MBF6584422.1 hypothetical protein [Nocardia farcinica]